MAHIILLHVSGEEAIVGEVEELPKATDTVITLTSPRRKDGKELQSLDNRAVKVIWPLARINFIEILGGEGEDQIISFVRE
jgi:hypothetical protein